MVPAALLIYPRAATHTVPPPLQASPKWGQRSADGCPRRPPQGARVRAPRDPKKSKARRSNSGYGPPAPIRRRRVKHHDESGSYQYRSARKNTSKSQRGAARSTTGGAHPANQVPRAVPPHRRGRSLATAKGPFLVSGSQNTAQSLFGYIYRHLFTAADST